MKGFFKTDKFDNGKDETMKKFKYIIKKYNIPKHKYNRKYFLSLNDNLCYNFNGNIEAEPHSDPKPEIADPGTFTKEGEVVDTTNTKDGEAQIDLSQPEENGTPDTTVGVDVNAGEQNN